MIRAIFSTALVLFALHAAGCSGSPELYPVTGIVLLPDKTPVTHGFVEFVTTTPQGKRINARGKIDERGNFRLGTHQLHDGAYAGEYQAIVVQPLDFAGGDLTNAKKNAPGIKLQYSQYETSGLNFRVSDGENFFTLKVEN